MEFRAADLCATKDFNLHNCWHGKRKDALDANATRNFSNGDRSVLRSTSTSRDDHAFKILNALFFTFNDFLRNADDHAGPDIGDRSFRVVGFARRLLLGHRSILGWRWGYIRHDVIME